MNIYTPNVDLNKDELLPVVVWIYGGGFITGSGVFTEYGPEKWLDQGIVVLTVNYRFGTYIIVRWVRDCINWGCKISWVFS